MKDYIKIGKKVTYLLRHKPGDLVMDKHGYVETLSLLTKVDITQEELDFIVNTNDKKRLAYKDESKKMIRASQGHSIEVDVELKVTRPPRVLYHGTSPDSYEKIIKSKGLDKMRRLHVHLTDSFDVAKSVGERYSKRNKPIILEIDSAAMSTDGYKFYLSDNGVWLTDNVPLKYIKINDLW